MGGKRHEYSMFEWKRRWVVVGGWLMNVIERCIMGPSIAAGFRMVAASMAGLHGVLR